MSKALLLDLREHVLVAIAEGMSCRQAAARFGVDASSAIRLRTMERAHGNARPKALGGDRRSRRIEAHAATILGMINETPDRTLHEIRSALAGRGVVVGNGAAAVADFTAELRKRITDGDTAARKLRITSIVDKIVVTREKIRVIGRNNPFERGLKAQTSNHAPVRSSAREWCPWPESNQHSLRNPILSRTRLPIPPQGHRPSRLRASPNMRLTGWSIRSRCTPWDMPVRGEGRRCLGKIRAPYLPTSSSGPEESGP